MPGRTQQKNAIEAVRENIRLATTKCHASQTSWKASLELSSRESLNKLKLCTQSEWSKQTDNTLGLANGDHKKPTMKE